MAPSRPPSPHPRQRWLGLTLTLTLTLPALGGSCHAQRGADPVAARSGPADGGLVAPTASPAPRAIVLSSEEYLDLVASTRAVFSALAVDADATHAFLGVQVQGVPRASALAVLTRATGDARFSGAARYVPLAVDDPGAAAPTTVSDIIVRDRRLYALWHDNAAAWLSTYELSPEGAPDEASLRVLPLGTLGGGSTGRLLLPPAAGGIAYVTTAYTDELGVVELDDRGVPVPTRPDAPNPRRARLPRPALGSIARSADGQRLFIGAAQDTLLEVPLRAPTPTEPGLRGMPGSATSHLAHRGAAPCVENRTEGANAPCTDDPYTFVATDDALFRTVGLGPALRGRAALERLALPTAGRAPTPASLNTSTYALAFDRAARPGTPRGVLWAAEATRVRAVDGRALVRGTTLVPRAPDTGLPLGIPVVDSGTGRIVSHLAVAAGTGTVVAMTEALDEEPQHGDVAAGYALRVTALAHTNPARLRFPSLPTVAQVLTTADGADQPLGSVKLTGLGQPSEWLPLDRALGGNGARKMNRLTISLGEDAPALVADNEELASELATAPSWSVRVELGRPLPGGAFEVVRSTEEGPIHGRSTTVFAPGYDVATFDHARFESLTERSRRWRALGEGARLSSRPTRIGTVCTAALAHGGEELVENVARAIGAVGCNEVASDYAQHLPRRWIHDAFARAGVPHAAPKYAGGRIDSGSDFLSGDHSGDIEWWRGELVLRGYGSLYQRQGASLTSVRTVLLDDEPGWSLDAKAPLLSSFPRKPASLRAFREWVTAHAGRGSGSRQPTPSRAATARSSAEAKRDYYWTVRYFKAAAAARLLDFNDALRKAVRAAPECQGGRACNHTSGVNWGNGADFRAGWWVVDGGPTGIIGSYDWFETPRVQAARAGGEGGSWTPGALAPWLDTKYPDALAQLAAFRADLMRSAVALPHLLPGAKPAPRARFGAHLTALWGAPMRDGLAMKALAHVARGARTIEYWAFGPEWQLPADGWSEAPRAYTEIARANQRLAWADTLLAEGERPRGRVAIQAEGPSALWSVDTSAHLVEPALLHAALTHAGYPVELVDDASLALGVLENNVDVLFLTQLHTDAAAQEAVARWVEQGGGTVVVLPGAGTRDEVDAPSRRLDKILGVTARSSATMVLGPLIPGRFGYERAGDLTPEPGVEPAWQVPRGEVLRVPCATAPCARDAIAGRFTASGAEVLARLGGEPAISRRRWPSGGAALQYGFFPGLQHWLQAEGRNAAALPTGHHPEQRAWAALAPANIERARPPGTLRPAITSVPGVEAAVVRAPKGTALVLFNWTGAPLPRGVTITLYDPRPFTIAVRDEQTPVAFRPVRGGVELTVPLDKVEVVRLCREQGVRDCR
ncbi:MAG: hypothetical protein IPF92_23945 [Myxococcales bacterium]|nr:hypothetical protein [Myxococcales bacterium]